MWSDSATSLPNYALLACSIIVTAIPGIHVLGQHAAESFGRFNDATDGPTGLAAAQFDAAGDDTSL